MRPPGSPPPRSKERHEGHQHPGPTPPMPRPFQHARAVNETTTRESAWSDIFGRNAPTIRKLQLLRQILATLLRTPRVADQWTGSQTTMAPPDPLIQ
ncbi:unnamed protein product [Schistocephalus solidus]|uniref:Uncharacterized protein n=1 Tax=Schistocephalus solidus TaxID=70667 RepID=A0A183T7H3_SCHSO|nr:unnamed protein product [Schistocephalus solidus]